MLESLPWWCKCQRDDVLTSLATNKALIWGFELSHPNNYPVYELLEHMKGLAWQSQSYRVSETQGNSGIAERSPD